jgi:phospholipid transport system substrate-binding protein
MATTFLAALLLSAAPQAVAGPPTEALRSAFARVNSVLAGPAIGAEPATRLAACRQAFRSVFDVRSAARYSLGRQWQARTPEEQNDFTTLFGDLIESSYVDWLATAAEVDPKSGVEVQYVAETVDGETALVRTAISSRRGRDLPVSYDMVYDDGRWQIRDVYVDDISVLANYRAQFTRIIRDYSYTGLLARMKALRSGEARPAAVVRAGPETAAFTIPMPASFQAP